MNVKDATELINEEFSSDTGLDTLFRLSADIDKQRISNFISALKQLAKHYENEVYMEKELVYKLFSFYQTLQASSNHWKVNRPKGLEPETCFEIFSSIRNIFTD